MKIRKRVRLNTSFATKAISDRFPHFGATKIGDSGRHGNPHFSVFYTRLATQSGRYPLKDEDARPPAGESRSTGAHPASGQRQQHFPAEGHALEERTIRQAAVAPTAGRMQKAASETDGLPSSRGQTGSALSAPPPHSRPAAKKRRTEKIVGYAEAPYVPAGGRTAHSSGHRIGGRSPAGARPPRGREASAPTAIPNTVFGATRDDRRAGFCTIRKYRHFYTPESALFRSDRGAVRHRRGRISGRGSLGKEYRYAGHCRPTAPYIGPAPTRLNVPASGGGGTSEAGRIGPDDNSAGSPPADRPVPHSQAEQTLLSASVNFRNTTDVPSVLSPNTDFRQQANGAPVLRPERTKVVDPRRGHCPTRHGFDQKRRTPAVVSVRPAVRAPFQTERKKQIEAARLRIIDGCRGPVRARILGRVL